MTCPRTPQPGFQHTLSYPSRWCLVSDQWGGRGRGGGGGGGEAGQRLDVGRTGWGGGAEAGGGEDGVRGRGGGGRTTPGLPRARGLSSLTHLSTGLSKGGWEMLTNGLRLDQVPGSGAFTSWFATSLAFCGGGQRRVERMCVGFLTKWCDIRGSTAPRSAVEQGSLSPMSHPSQQNLCRALLPSVPSNVLFCRQRPAPEAA